MRQIALSAVAVAAIAIPFVSHAAHRGEREARPAAPAQSASQTDSLTKQLITKESATWELAIKHDAGAYKALHADGYFTVSGSGLTERGPSEESALDANVRFSRWDLSDFSVRFVADDAALVTYRAKASGLDHGKPFQLDSYATSLWVKRDGSWLNVFYQATPAATN
jgi:hypothetical protein